MPSEHSVSMQPGWQQRLAVIGSPHIIRRAVTAAFVVGSILILLNQGDLIFSGQISRRVVVKSLLTPIIPFCVTMLGALLNTATPTTRPEALRPGKAAVRRSLIIAVIVGSVIIALNQGDILISGAITPLILAKVIMTPCVPFCVSLYGAYIAYRHAVARQQS